MKAAEACSLKRTWPSAAVKAARVAHPTTISCARDKNCLIVKINYRHFSLFNKHRPFVHLFPAVPECDPIGSRRHMIDGVTSIVIGHGKVRVLENEDRCVHVRVDIAVYVDDSRMIETHRP